MKDTVKHSQRFEQNACDKDKKVSIGMPVSDDEFLRQKKQARKLTKNLAQGQQESAEKNAGK